MKTVLFGLDGATFTILDDLVARGVMPNLARIYEQGVRAELQSSPLPLTPQAWTTMSTGRSPGHHGIADWAQFRWGERGNFGHINDSRDNHAETLWRYVSRQGRRATVLNYYGTAPAQEISGHSIPGFTSGRHLRRSSYPSDLFARLEGVEGLDAKVLGLDLEIERQVLQEMAPELWGDWLRHHIARDRAWFGILAHLMQHEPSDLSAIVFDGVDKLQHLAYRYLDPAYAPREPSSWEAEVIGLCHEYFRQIDTFLGRTLDLVGPWGRVFVVSDHGFTASHEILYINRWLAEQGWLVWKGEQQEDLEEACATLKPENDVNAIDLERSQAFAFTPSANGIWIQKPAAEYDAFRRELMRRLLELRGPDGGQVVTHVRSREEIFAGPQMDKFPDLTVELRDFGFVSVLNSSEVVRPRSAPFGTHHPHGVVLGMGMGLRSGARVERQNILDIAPLVLHSLGLEIPAEYDGRVPIEFYDPNYLASDPPRIAVTAEPSTSRTSKNGNQPQDTDTTGEVEMDAEDEAILMERLKSLGYIE